MVNFDKIFKQENWNKKMYWGRKIKDKEQPMHDNTDAWLMIKKKK